MDGNPQPAASYRHVAVVGTDTGVGKTQVTVSLIAGLRALGRRVWVHKPVACGDWDGATADDGRRLVAAVGDGQTPATVCPHQFPEPASPHLAARAAGKPLSAALLAAGLDAVIGAQDLIVEGAGGLLTPLAEDRSTIVDLLHGRGIPLLIVTRPDLGTLNHTALTVAVARSRGLTLLGLVLNRPRPVLASLATDSAAAELARCCGVPVLADLPHGAPTPAIAAALAAAVLRSGG